jgi:hypothetical protein
MRRPADPADLAGVHLIAFDPARSLGVAALANSAVGAPLDQAVLSALG